MSVWSNLNNIAQSKWDYINNVAKNITAESLEAGWKKYMVRGDEELAKAVSNSQIKKVSAFDFIKQDDIDNIYKGISNPSEEISSAYNDLSDAIKSKNITNAKDIAEKRFQDTKFLEYLMEAEDKKTKKINGIKTMVETMPENINAKYIKDAKDTIKDFSVFGYKPGEALLGDKGRENLAKARMKTKGNYFNSGDTKTNQIRAGVVGGTYLGVSTIGRIAQGGSPITNEYGERDIVGIPFI